MKTKIIALDLDGTLLNEQKTISPRNIEVLKKAADCGVHIVPATGRMIKAIPGAVLELPFIHYLITINGAVVWDLSKDTHIYKKVFSREQALELWDYMQQFDALYDMYASGEGLISPDNMDKVDEYARREQTIRLINTTRRIIPDMRMAIASGCQVEKFNMYFKDLNLLEKVKAGANNFPYVLAATSMYNNIELNHKDANKGTGLIKLAEYLNVDMSETVAIGDGDNDIPMIEAAGLGIAMENAMRDVKLAADQITLTNDEDGVAEVVERLINQ